jgi:uncharacterized protein (TIGR02147 family)
MSFETGFNIYLQEEFERRKCKNSNYSLRAFARSLSIGHTPLSEIMKGKRNISSKMKEKLGLKLGLSLEEIDQFIEDNCYRQIDMDQFSLISKWYHFPLLEMLRLKREFNSAQDFAKALGISAVEVENAFARFQRLGLIKKDENERLIEVIVDGNTSSYHSEKTNAAKVQMQKDFIKKSMHSLENDSFTERSHTGMTMAIKKEKLYEAKEKIRQFQRELCEFLSESKGNDEVYHLNVGLFPLTKLDMN